MTLPLLLLAALPCAAQVSYTIENVGTVSATPSDPVYSRGINNRGHMLVANQRTMAGGGAWDDRAVFWDGQTGTVIVPSTGGGSTWAGGLNDDDWCVGHETVTALHFQGWIWNPAAGTTHTLNLGMHDFTAPRMIDAHRIVGGDFTSNEIHNFQLQNHAFLAKPNGQYLDLGAVHDQRSRFKGMNDLGQVIGTTGIAPVHGFHWTMPGGMQLLPTLGGNGCLPDAINNRGSIVGQAQDAQANWRPFLYENGVMTDLGTLPGDAEGHANDINEFGNIVGYSGTSGSGSNRAVVWIQGTLHDLNTLIPAGSGWVLTNASSINELGEIAGTGLYQGNRRAFRLTPDLTSFRISGFAPGIAGEDNRMFGIGFTPGASVEVYFGFQPGFTQHSCGMPLGIDQARLMFTTTADADGRIEVPAWLPPHAQGRSARYQAIEPSSCTTSEIRQQTIL